MQGWIKADERRVRYTKGSSLSFDHIQLMHKDAGFNQEDIPNPGKVREDIARISGGDYRMVPPTHSTLNRLTNSYEEWLINEKIKCQNGEKSVILTATQAYQRLVSIHPFENGNGRVSRLMMDYILEYFGLPPAILGEEVNDAVFCLKPKSTTDMNTLVCKIFEGVTASHTMINEGVKK